MLHLITNYLISLLIIANLKKNGDCPLCAGFGYWYLDPDQASRQECGVCAGTGFGSVDRFPSLTTRLLSLYRD